MPAKPKLTKTQIEWAREEVEKGRSIRSVAGDLDVSHVALLKRFDKVTAKVTKPKQDQEKIKFFHYAWFLAKNSARPTEARAIKELMELNGIELDEELAKRIYWEMKENRKNNHNNHKKGGV